VQAAEPTEPSSSAMPVEPVEEPLVPTAHEPNQTDLAVAAKEQAIPVANLFGIPVPITAPAGYSAWSLFDLLATIICALLLIVAALFAVSARKKNNKEQEGHSSDNSYRKPRPLMLALLAGSTLVAVVLFVVTQNIKLPVVIFDYWSLFFALILIAAIIFALRSVGKKQAKQTEQAR
ncbi:MAG: hypothetical protein FWD27_08820, partial [Coriobacteriia bacterium]|nr:hypothetical protein [Coriobacteriia bacterium]